MTRQEAVRKLQKLYGKKAGCRVENGAIGADERAKASEASKEVAAMKRELEERIEQRKRELLNVPDYQAMLAAREELKKKLNDLMGVRLQYKFTAGYVSDFGAFHIEGQGDTWEEVFRQIEAKRVAR